MPVTSLTPTIWRNSIQLAANIDAQQDATLAALIPGQVVAVLYNSGQQVAQGTVLVRLNDAGEIAQLALDQAKQKQAMAARARAQKLLNIAGASVAALEQAEAEAGEATAQVAADQAAIARLNITAPFAGILGIRTISVGSYIAAGQEVAQITQAVPLRVLFSVPQTEAGGLAVGDEFSLQAAAGAQAGPPADGHITALSPIIDSTTDAREGEGVLSNNTQGLLPGMTASITLQTGTPLQAYTLPATALNDSVLGRYVYALAPQKNGNAILHAVYVTEYAQSGSQAVISADNLPAGSKVVAIGGYKLNDGQNVTIQN